MKSVMGGQSISIRSRVESGLAIYKAHRRGICSVASGNVSFHRKLLGHLRNYTGKSVTEARILDLGCGQTATQTALFHADGAAVTGIDVEVPTFSMDVPTFIRSLRLNGPERALKSLARHLLFDGRYFRALSDSYGREVSFKGIDVRIMDATATEFADCTFDFVFSMAVFEHISDVKLALRELNRVLKPTGIAVITPHLFCSLSGGHCFEWASPDHKPATKVAPWDHLRENKHPVGAYMNRLKVRAYREYFREALDVVAEETSTEGERLLTPELEAELAAKGFTREDLLTRYITFYARKRLPKTSVTS